MLEQESEGADFYYLQDEQGSPILLLYENGKAYISNAQALDSHAAKLARIAAAGPPLGTH